MAEEKDAQFVEDVVRAIVTHPEDVKTTRKVDEMGVLIELSVNPEDMGKIIGKEGRTAKAIRTLLRVLGAQSNARINLKIAEPEGSTHVPHASAAMESDDAPAAPAPVSEDPLEDAKSLMDELAAEEKGSEE